MAGSPRKAAPLRRGHGPHTADVALRDEQPPLPKPPAGLLAKSRKHWRAYWESSVARAADPSIDLHLVERWIRAVDEYERVLPEVISERTVAGSMGQSVLNPLVSYLDKLKDEIRRAEDALGMSPKARAQLGLAIAESQLAAKRAHFTGPSIEPEEDPRLVLIQ